MMAQRFLNMASGAPKTLGPGILAASSPNINLSTNMASEAEKVGQCMLPYIRDQILEIVNETLLVAVL